jgi:hypothetical protein
LEYIKQPVTEENSDENFQCFEPKTVSLQRTGTIKIVTISALISHFLPYFNSSINPIIYNIMSGNKNTSIKFLFKVSIFLFILDKFRLKFRELFSSCCCCCKTVVRMKSTSIPFKSSGIIQHSPISTNNYRSSIRIKQKTNLNSGSGQISGNVNSNNMTRHTGINVYTHNGPICFRLTNV